MAPDILTTLPEPKRPNRKLISDNNLNSWLNEAATKSGLTKDRIQWQLASAVTTAFLQQKLRTAGGAAGLLLKGGSYLDFILDTTRATSDLDMSSRFNSEELKERILALDEADFGPFVMRIRNYRTTGVPTKPDNLKPVSFNISAFIGRTALRKIRVEIAFGEGNMLSNENAIPAPSTHFFGFDLPAAKLIGISMAYQVAQKIHAVSTPSDSTYKNERVRDLTDLILIRQALYPDGSQNEDLLKAAIDIFEVRASERKLLGFVAHDWPPVIPDHTWEELYPIQASEVGLTMTYQQALIYVNAWIEEIAATAL